VAYLSLRSMGIRVGLLGGIVALVLFSAVVLLLIRLMAAAPQWATLPILLSPVVVAFVVLRVMRGRRGRIDGAAILAEAEKPLAQQANFPSMKRYLSPDRRFVAVTGANEVQMSHWIESLAVHDVVRSRMILDLTAPWDVGTPEWGPDNHLRFHASKYPGDAPGVDVDLDPGAGVARLHDSGAEVTVPIARVLSSLNGFHERSGRVGLNLFT
jgi:hypothetical protein